MTPDPITQHLKSLISDELKKQEYQLKENEAQQIVKALIPEIDKLISERVKQHFIELADFMKEKFSKEK
ncbi:MAG: hypothetical protein ACFFG0_01920 [Candidatus Thorarchaeota archaeon]